MHPRNVASPADSFEPLEHLGDAVINEAIANCLMSDYVGIKPKAMSTVRKLVASNYRLSKLATELRLGYFMVACNGEGFLPSKRMTLSDLFEAVVGALRRDQGHDTAAEFILKHLKRYIEVVLKIESVDDEKKKLELLMQYRFGAAVVYRNIGRRHVGFKPHVVYQVFAVEDWYDIADPSMHFLIGEGDGGNENNAMCSAAADARRWLTKEGAAFDLLLEVP